MNNNHFALEMRGIHKTYPGVRALKGVDLAIREGEVHALVGENGAGKSTLMKILAGAESKDEGEILVSGQPVKITSPNHSQELGISIIYQEFNLVPQLGAAENIFLGREPSFFGFINYKKEYSEARAILDSLGVELDVNQPVNTLSIAQQQMIEIAKALSMQSKIIAMDEPSATLTDHELKNLFRLIRHLKEKGVSVIYISHRLEEIFEICDRMTVMRDGEWVGTEYVANINREKIIEMMVGRKITDEFPKEIFSPGQELLRIERLSGGIVKEVSLKVHQGEIVALTGLVGAGRTETARMIFGADKTKYGDLFLEGKKVKFHTPRQAIDSGICLLTEDRKHQGLILGMRIRENVTLPTLKDFCRMIFTLHGKEKSTTQESIENLHIKAPSTETEARNLSGGNQQKVVLAKWLLANSKVFIFDEPTRGIDVGAKREIYLLMNDLLRKGAGIIMISSELPEVLGMADRIMVMSSGRIAGELNRTEATQEKIMDLATSSPVLNSKVA